MENVIVGVDEAGRGAFFSRIYSVAVAFTENIREKVIEDKIVIRDSKKMTPRQRLCSYEYLKQHVRYGVGYCDEKEIDEKGITKCNILCMHRALENLLSQYPNMKMVKIHVDGVLFAPFQDIPHETIVRGDDSHMEIAMASILAKTIRDLFIIGLCDEDSSLEEKYDLRKNKGYGTVRHREGIRKHGSHPLHRQSFLRKCTSHHLRFL